MASCKYNPGINNVNPYAVLNVTQQSQNIANNTSTVRYELLLYRPSAISSSAPKAYSIVINGKTVKSGSTTIGGSGTKSIASGTVTIPHNSDGTKNINFSFSLVFGLTWHGQSIGTGSARGSMTLSTISRATTPTLSPSNLNLGSTITIDLPRASTSFTHNLTWKFGNLSGSIGNGIATQATLATSASWASQIPNGSSGTGYIYCDTYNGETKIGSKTATFTARVSTGTEPIINSIRIVESIAEIATKFQNYVQNKSKLSISINASGRSGATIKFYKTTICGINYSGSSFTSSEITESGRVNITVAVTDSRGLTTSETRVIDVIPYSLPKITKFTSERGDAMNQPSAVGRTAMLNVDYEVDSIGGKNTCKVEFFYKETEAIDWILLGSRTDFSFNGVIGYTEKYFEDKTYQAKILITDYFGSTEVIYDSVPMAVTLININRNGTSMCFGGMSERVNETCFDFKFPVYADSIYLKNKDITEQKVLWENGNGLQMSATDSVYLSEEISKQQHGIVLMFSAYINGTVQNYHWNSCFLHKEFIMTNPNAGHGFFLTGNATLNYVSNKYLYFTDSSVKGHENNVWVGTRSGIDVQNNAFVLRKIIGV